MRNFIIILSVSVLAFLMLNFFTSSNSRFSASSIRGITTEGIPSPASNNSQTQATPTTASSNSAIQLAQPTASQYRTIAKVTKVIDGDTIEIDAGKSVRLIGIDTPESGEPYYNEAKKALENLLLNQKVTLEKDISETDQYGRLLRNIFLGSTYINQTMINLGLARIYTYPPDVRYSDILLQAENQVRQKQIGLWSKQTPPNETCVIKGNINAKGDKIFFLPESESYQRTYIDESKNEKWFCNETEAQAAGWRKSSK